METGHLDRVLHGILAEEVLSACDENVIDASPHGSTSELGLSNPAVHLLRGLRHRNLNAIRHATQRGIHQLQQLQSHNNSDNIFLLKNRSSPLTIQGLRTNPKDAESHILFFDIESLIFELHSEEYATMSPTTLEVSDKNNNKNYGKCRKFIEKLNFQAQGLITTTKEQHNDASKKISGKRIFFSFYSQKFFFPYKCCLIKHYVVFFLFF